MRDNFSARVKDTLAKRVGFRCSNPQCGKVTSGPQSDPQKAVNVGVAAHITGASPNGPRYDANLSPYQRKAIENGIWLCQNCAKLVDDDERKYTPALLRQWKDSAERSTSKLLEAAQQFAETTKANDNERPGKIIKEYWFVGTPHDFFEVVADILDQAPRFANVLPVWYSSEGVSLSLSWGWTDTASIIDVTQFDIGRPYRSGWKAVVLAMEEREGKTATLFVDGYDLNKAKGTPCIGRPFSQFADFVVAKMIQHDIKEWRAT